MSSWQTNNKTYEVYNERLLLKEYKRHFKYVDGNFWGAIKVLTLISSMIPFIIFVSDIYEKNPDFAILLGIASAAVWIACIYVLNYAHKKTMPMIYPFDKWLQKHKVKSINNLKNQKWMGSIDSAKYDREIYEINQWGKPLI